MLDRLLTVIGDRRNVAGLAGAAAGLGLTFGGVVEAGWWAITGGLYAAGFLGAQILAPAPRALPGGSPALPLAELPDDLRRLTRRVGPQLPPPAQTHLAAIVATVTDIEPKLRAVDPNSISVISLRQIIADYVPATLNAYVALPTRARSALRLGDGRTADALLTDQLALLDTQMREIADTLSRGDLDALEVQGRFLEEKFRSADLFIH